MSSWWEITFFATGDLDKIDELERSLPSLFHIVSETDRTGGALLAHVAQNYGGSAAIEDIIEGYPDVAFNGTMLHEQADVGSTHSVFTGAQGAAEWREYTFRAEGRPITAADLRDELSKLDAKIARLRKRHDFYTDELGRMEPTAGDDRAVGSHGGSGVGELRRRAS